MASSTPGRVSARAHASARPLTTLQAVLAAAPERAVLIGVALALSCAATVSLGALRPWTTLPLAAALTVLGWRVLPAPEKSAAAARGGGYALAGALGWLTVNIPWAAEYLIVRRDPGFLTLSGFWLVDHPSTDMPALGAPEARLGVANLLADAPEAWNLHGDMIQPQGAKLLPAMLAVGGWIGGDNGVYAANLAIGALGLLAVYVLARRFMGPIAALAPMVGVALTVAHIWLSRSPYTEPLTMFLLVAGMGWALRALELGRLTALIGAALATGATVFARIDGAAYAAGAAVGVTAALAASRSWPRRWRAVALSLFLAVQVATASAGYASALRWSRAYVQRLGDESIALAAGYGAAVLGGLVLCAVWWARPNSAVGGRRPRRAPQAWAAASAALIGAIFLAAAARVWWPARKEGGFSAEFVQWLQAREGLPVDGTRYYAEQTLVWISFYITWPLVALAAVGFCWGGFRLVRGHWKAGILIAGFLAPTLLYLWRPAVVPDQVWAIRRLYGTGVVGFIVVAAVAGQWLARLARTRWGERRARGLWKAVATLVATLPLLGWVRVDLGSDAPFHVSSPIFLKEQVGARQQVEELCALTAGRPVILVGTSSHFGVIRAKCDSPILLSLRPLDAQDVAGIVERWGGEAVILTQQADSVPWTVEPQAPVLESTVHFAGSSLRGIPAGVGGISRQDYRWYAGEARADGSVEPLPPPS